MHIYAIINKTNGKKYIGQHSRGNLQAYFKTQLKYAMSGRKDKPVLYNAIRSYGPDNFYIESWVQPIDKQQMDALEIFFIRTEETQNREFGYNLGGGGAGPLGIKRTNPVYAENCRRLAAAKKGKPAWNRGVKATWDHPNKGKKGILSPERLAKISQKGKSPWNKGKTGVYSEETLRKIREARSKQVFTDESRMKMSLAQIARQQQLRSGAGNEKQSA